MPDFLKFPIAVVIILLLVFSPKLRRISKKFYEDRFFRKANREANDTKVHTKSLGEEDMMPKRTPLMITPEQVKNYDDRPWRPFRWPYHQTMSIYKLDVNHWLDMDKYYWHYIEEKQRIWHQYGKQNIDWLPEPESYEACLELLHTVVDHMLVRYPLLFRVLVDKTNDRGKIIRNEMTKEILDMTLPLKEHPLLYVSKMAKEDFYVLLQSPKDMRHYLVAAAVPFPGGSFGIDKKLGKHLDEIHDYVPYYHEKLKSSMEKWFDRLQPSAPAERASWYITWDHKLKVNNIYQLPKFVPNLEGDMKSTDPRQFNVRVERQTIRRLPKSRAIIFTNHPIFYSIDEMKDEPNVPSLLKKIIFEAPEGIIKYKNFEFIRAHISDYLDSLIKAQKEKGLIDENTPVKTLPTYPFAHWVSTDFDYVNGWSNPNYASEKKPNYIADMKTEKMYGNE